MRRTAAYALGFIVSLGVVLPVSAQDSLQELEIEIVTGRRERDMPNLGYQPPEVFDPFTDQLYQGGYRDFPPTEIPAELKFVTALARTKKMKRIMACADAWYYPFSHTARRAEAPGIDIEILRSIAKRYGWQVDMTWANTGTRFGAGAAFARTIDRGYCDVFLGLVITGDDHHMTNHRLQFSRPYLGVGFVLVTKGKATGINTLADLKQANVKVGVPAYSPMHDYMLANGIAHESYFQNHRLIDAMVRGDVDAGMVWAPALAAAKKEKGIDLQMVPSFVPQVGQRWNGAWAIQSKETEYKEFIDAALTEMLVSGEIQRIVESYGVPFYTPFVN